MEQGHVDAVVRIGNEQGALRQLRQSGWVPAVLYGASEASTPISVPERVLSGNLSASRKFVELSVNGRTVTALIQAVQRDPLTKRVTHADFYCVDINRPTDVDIPVQLHGVDQAQRRGCIVQQQLRSISVRAMPKDAPEYISVDVSSLAAGEHLTVGDIALPSSIRLMSDAAEVLVTALAPSHVVVPEAIPAAQPNE